MPGVFMPFGSKKGFNIIPQGIIGLSSTPSTDASAYTVNANTQLYLKLNGDNTDSSGKGNSLTDNSISYGNARFAEGATFNGSTGYISCANSSSVNQTNSITISLWVYKTANQISDYCAFLEKSYSTSYFFGEATVEGSLAFFYGNTVLKNDSALFANNTWNNVLVSFNRATTTCTLYLNGNSVATSSSFNPTVSGTTNPVFIGRQQVAGRQYTGVFDEIIIENRAWTAGEVLSYYNASILVPAP